MSMWSLVLGLMVMGVVVMGMVSGARAAGPGRVVVLTQSEGFVHDVVKPRGEDGKQPSVVQEVWTALAERGGFEVQFIDHVRGLTAERLASTDLVVFYTTGELPFAEGQYEAFERWIDEGGAFLGIHCATDTLKQHPRYPRLIGARFASHSWNAGDTITLKVHDAAHPAARPYAPARTFKEEIYQFDDLRAEEVRILMSLDMDQTGKKRPYHVPIAWCKQQGKGRVFYTSLGHREDVWRSAEFQDHLLGAVRWLRGEVEADAAPNPELHQREQERARTAAAETP